MDYALAMRKAMKARGTSQASLSRKTGIPTGLIARYYSGKSVPGLVKAKSIANALELPLMFFTAEFSASEPEYADLALQLFIDKSASPEDYKRLLEGGDILGQVQYESWFYRRYLDPSDESAFFIGSQESHGPAPTKLERLIVFLYHTLEGEKKRKVDDILFDPERLAEVFSGAESAMARQNLDMNVEGGRENPRDDETN